MFYCTLDLSLINLNKITIKKKKKHGIALPLKPKTSRALLSLPRCGTSGRICVSWTTNPFGKRTIALSRCAGSDERLSWDNLISHPVINNVSEYMIYIYMFNIQEFRQEYTVYIFFESCFCNPNDWIILDWDIYQRLLNVPLGDAEHHFQVSVLDYVMCSFLCGDVHLGHVSTPAYHCHIIGIEDHWDLLACHWD